MSRPSKYIPGDLVFAKVKGYPPWPARVTSCKSKRYKVFFYGTFETARLKQEDIWPYKKENVDKFGSKNSKRKGYAEGLEQIANTPEIAPVEEGLDLEVSTTMDTSYEKSVDNTEASLVIDQTSSKSTAAFTPMATPVVFLKSKSTSASAQSWKRKAVDSSGSSVKKRCIEDCPVKNEKMKSTSLTITSSMSIPTRAGCTKRKAIDLPDSSPSKRPFVDDSPPVNYEKMATSTSDRCAKRKAVNLPNSSPSKRPFIEDSPVDYEKMATSINDRCIKRKAVCPPGTSPPSKRRIIEDSEIKNKKTSRRRPINKPFETADEPEKKLGFELAKPVAPSGFQMFGTPPVFKLTQEHFDMGLLRFYHEVLQPLFQIYPAIIGRPSAPVDPPDFSELYKLKVIPKNQVIHNKHGVGFIQETKSKQVTVGEFIQSAKKSPELNTDKDEKFYATEKIKSQYVNDLENFKISVNGGWDLEKEDLGLSELGPMSGISTVWHYISHPNSASPIHNEDQNLCSVNQNHRGGKKYWYCYKQEDTEKIAKVAAELLPIEFQKCDAYLNHKQVFLNPGMMAEKFNFDVFKLVQIPGDFVFTAPGVLHQIWNEDVSVNSAVNFLPDDPISAKVIQSKKQCSKSCMFREKSLHLPVLKLDHKVRRCLNEACKSTYASEHGLVEHMKVCSSGKKVGFTSKDLPEIQCPWCNKIVKKLGDHISKIHKEKDVVTCNLCGIETKEIKKHYQTCRQCVTCGASFTRSREKAKDHFCLQKYNLI